ncbi:hypothetical protein A6U97_12185 [Agrobacterium tumefaciens]|uniref:hypothetical protein n=1 Tax=Agrobacterium tumefaciens TaxID=358 RepID=UPI0008100759|nr:hypothetical protein A6U97_12185 [Agrobacterium tumefaciens]
MMSVANHAPLPFFDRLPIRARLAVRRASDLAELPNQNADMVFTILCADLKLIGVEPPTRTEFAVWFEDVKAEAANEAAAIDCFVRDVGSREALRPKTGEIDLHFGKVNANAGDELRIRQARIIVEAAHALNEAKLAAGYSPASILLDDTIVQQALIELLEAGDTATMMDADNRMTPGNKLADLLLAEADGDIDGKLVGSLTMDMQPELCRILSTTAHRTRAAPQ